MIGGAYCFGIIMGFNMGKNGVAKIPLPSIPKKRKLGNLTEVELDVREHQQQVERARDMIGKRRVL